jgi:hypothetical protein
MIGKAGVWGHFGSWSFERSMAYTYATTYRQQEALEKIEAMGLSKTDAASLYAEVVSLPSPQAANSWISGWPNYLTQGWTGCTAQNRTIKCQTTFGYQQSAQGTIAVDGVAFRTNKLEDAAITIGVYAQQGRLGEVVTRPKKVVFLARGADELKVYYPKQDNTPAGLFVPSILIREGGTPEEPVYDVLFADELQVDSMFTQLYFLDGASAPHFHKLSSRTEMGGGVITLWKVEFPED